jgi:phosphoribosyl 1,2-cyclic phosphodiesterase
VRITLWGTRGSIPSPGKHTVLFGGNTPCAEVMFDDGTDVIIDAGSGIRDLGRAMMDRKHKAEAFLLFSHYHWDHIQGLPFFSPGYIKGNRIKVYGVPGPASFVQSMLSRQMESPYFPVSLNITFPMLDFYDLPPNALKTGKGEVTYLRTNHPDFCAAYKFRENGKTFIYFTDNELHPPDRPQTTRQEMIEFCRDADVLLHDGQYTKKEISRKMGWGHSTNVDACDLAIESGCAKIILFHHDPTRSDPDIKEMVEEARTHTKIKGSKLEVEAAVEGQEIILK